MGRRRGDWHYELSLLTALDHDVEIVIRRKLRPRKAGRISVVAARQPLASAWRSFVPPSPRRLAPAKRKNHSGIRHHHRAPQGPRVESPGRGCYADVVDHACLPALPSRRRAEARNEVDVLPHKQRFVVAADGRECLAPAELTCALDHAAKPPEQSPAAEICLDDRPAGPICGIHAAAQTDRRRHHLADTQQRLDRHQGVPRQRRPARHDRQRARRYSELLRCCVRLRRSP
jgi:hypothetical protein